MTWYCVVLIAASSVDSGWLAPAKVCALHAPGQHAQQFGFCTVDGQQCIRGHTRPRAVERSDGKVLRFDHAKVACGVFEQGLRHIQTLKAWAAATQGAGRAHAIHAPTQISGHVIPGPRGVQRFGLFGVTHRHACANGCVGCFKRTQRLDVFHQADAGAVLAPAGPHGHCRARRPPLACPRARGSGDKRHRGARTRTVPSSLCSDSGGG